MTPKLPTLVCSIATGDIFRVWPGDRAHLIVSERDLLEFEYVRNLKPDPSCDFRFACSGMTFERIVYIECEVCGGDGREVGPVWISEDEDGYIAVECATHHRGHAQGAVYSEELSHTCCKCFGSGLTPRWTGEIITKTQACEEAV